MKRSPQMHDGVSTPRSPGLRCLEYPLGLGLAQRLHDAEVGMWKCVWPIVRAHRDVLRGPFANSRQCPQLLKLRGDVGSRTELNGPIRDCPCQGNYRPRTCRENSQARDMIDCKLSDFLWRGENRTNRGKRRVDQGAKRTRKTACHGACRRNGDLLYENRAHADLETVKRSRHPQSGV